MKTLQKTEFVVNYKVRNSSSYRLYKRVFDSYETARVLARKVSQRPDVIFCSIIWRVKPTSDCDSSKVLNFTLVF